MKRVFAVLCAAFPAALLLAQTPRLPERLFVPSPKNFPPEIAAPSATTGTSVRHKIKFPHSYCIHANPDGKSLSVQRCEPAPSIRLIAPFKATSPAKSPAK